MEELRSIILLRKVLPAGTTIAAKLRVPMRDRRSRLEQLERFAQVSRAWCMSLSCWGGGGGGCRVEEYSQVLQASCGPSHLSLAKGTPRTVQREVRVFKWCVQCSESSHPGSGGWL